MTKLEEAVKNLELKKEPVSRSKAVRDLLEQEKTKILFRLSATREAYMREAERATSMQIIISKLETLLREPSGYAIATQGLLRDGFDDLESCVDLVLSGKIKLFSSLPFPSLGEEVFEIQNNYIFKRVAANYDSSDSQNSNRHGMIK